MDKAGAPGLPLNSQAGRHATGRWRRHGQQTSVGKLGILFSHIFTYFHIFSHIFTYFHIFSHIFTYFHIFSHIFTYFQIGVPKNWDRKRLLYMAEMMNKQQNKHSKFLRQGLQKACTRLSKGHGNFATTWCTSSWLNYLVSRLPFAHLVQLGFKGVSHTISKKWGTLRSSWWAHDSTIPEGWNMLDKSEHWTSLNHYMGPGACGATKLTNMSTNMFHDLLGRSAWTRLICMRIQTIVQDKHFNISGLICENDRKWNRKSSN